MADDDDVLPTLMPQAIVITPELQAQFDLRQAIELLNTWAATAEQNSERASLMFAWLARGHSLKPEMATNWAEGFAELQRTAALASQLLDRMLSGQHDGRVIVPDTSGHTH